MDEVLEELYALVRVFMIQQQVDHNRTSLNSSHTTKKVGLNLGNFLNCTAKASILLAPWRGDCAL